MFIESALIAAKDGLVHRGKIIGALDGFDNKASIFRSGRFAILKDHDTGDIFRTGNIRDVE